jgi:uncharacterized protein (DUF2235 family)
VKRLIVCADGTWNEPTQNSDGKPTPTNVVKFARMLATTDDQGISQVVSYHEGLGTNGGLWERFTGGAFGAGISKNIEDTYLFLAYNFEVGDELWLFGFSRGAYTVRSLAGLIRNCGVLRREHFELYAQAYELYRDRNDSTHPNGSQAVEFRERYSNEARIRCIGVWDTVGALGIPVTPLRFWSKKANEFHDVELSGTVDFAFQALAIDEKRKPFGAAVWTRNDPEKSPAQVLEQAWFPGVHCDIGGGYAQSGISDAALLWMIERAKRAGLGFSTLDELKPSPTAPMHKSMTLGYRALGDGTRTLGTTNPGGRENLAEFTEERRKSLAYEPQNLVDFLRQSSK